VTAPAIVWIVVGSTTTVAMAAAIIALARHVLVLGRSLRRFQEEIQPLTEDIVDGATRASSRGQRLRSELPSGPR
jgi:hypothetical protein